jgi:hypothetical protein
LADRFVYLKLNAVYIPSSGPLPTETNASSVLVKHKHGYSIRFQPLQKERTAQDTRAKSQPHSECIRGQDEPGKMKKCCIDIQAQEEVN